MANQDRLSTRLSCYGVLADLYYRQADEICPVWIIAKQMNVERSRRVFNRRQGLIWAGVNHD